MCVSIIEQFFSLKGKKKDRKISYLFKLNINDQIKISRHHKQLFSLYYQFKIFLKFDSYTFP